jgi:outer membrane lipoprotein-sorting protein
MEIIKGKNKGSIAVYKDGSVRARHGGIFKPFVATCKITDRMVTSLRGGTITESDWLSIVDKLKAYRQDNKLKNEGIRERGGRKAYLLAIDGLDEDGVTARKLWIDASSFLPLASETYEGKILVNSMDYSDIALNIKIPDGLFDL